MKPTFFRNAAAFRAWLRVNHKTATEITLRLVKNHAADTGMTYPEALDEALCYGWIDGVRRSFDADSYTQRFSPRRKGSVWSGVNIGHVGRLIAAKRMTKAGLAEFEKRGRVVSYTGRPRRSDPGRSAVSPHRQGVGLLLGGDAVVPARVSVVAGRRQARRDAPEAAGDPDRQLGQGAAASAAPAREVTGAYRAPV